MFPFLVLTTSIAAMSNFEAPMNLLSESQSAVADISDKYMTDGNDVFLANMDDLCHYLDVLHDAAIAFGCSDIINDSLGYLRSRRGGYTGGAWEIVAGSINGKIVNFIEESSDTNIRWMNDFFDSLARSNVSLPDPWNPKERIDVIHMFATMDGSYIHTGRNSLLTYPNPTIDLCGWGGDLQQAAHIQGAGIVNDFKVILSDERSGFSYSDFSADVYGRVIASSLMKENLADSLRTFFDQYRYARKSLFTTFLYDLTSKNWLANTRMSDVYDLACYLLHFDSQTGRELGDEFGQVTFLNLYRCGKNPCDHIPSALSSRKAMAQCFVGYLFAQIS